MSGLCTTVHIIFFNPLTLIAAKKQSDNFDENFQAIAKLREYEEKMSKAVFFCWQTPSGQGGQGGQKGLHLSHQVDRGLNLSMKSLKTGGPDGATYVPTLGLCHTSWSTLRKMLTFQGLGA